MEEQLIEIEYDKELVEKFKNGFSEDGIGNSEDIQDKFQELPFEDINDPAEVYIIENDEEEYDDKDY